MIPWRGQVRFPVSGELARRLGIWGSVPRPPELMESVLSGSGFTVDDVMNADKHVIRNCDTPMAYRKWEKGLPLRAGRNKPG
ncbi:MAG: hypothetical protein R2860_04560 [Desulfobacterales bacterium]